MQHSTDRILTTHAGSLLRPKSLIAIHTAKYAGKTVAEAELAQTVAAATRAIIAKQIEAGLDIVNNGELGRESFLPTSSIA